MKTILVLAAAAAAQGGARVPAPAPAAPPPPAASASPQPADLDRFEAAMAASDYQRSAKLAQALIVARRRAGLPLAPDPLLNGLVGRLMLSGGDPSQALGYLVHSEGPGVPERQRTAARLALAEAEESVGDVDAAKAAVARALDGTSTPADQRRMALEAARLALTDDPAAALAGAQRLVEGPGRWEAEAISAQAEALLGRLPEARAAADRAWIAAAEAPPSALAPIRVALLRAGLAAAAGDRGTMLAMLVAGGGVGRRVQSKAADYLPVCGEEALGAADYATFALVLDQDGNEHLSPVGASRPAAVRPFFDALAGRTLLEEGSSTAPGGILLTLRCRPYVSRDYEPPSRSPDPWTDWAGARGLYADIAREGSLEDINAISEEIDRLSREGGDDNPQLIPLRGQLWQFLEARARSDGDVEEWQVADVRRKMTAAAAKIGGTEGLLMSEADAVAARAIETAGNPEEAIRLFRAAMQRRIATLPLDRAYAEMTYWFRADRDLSPETRHMVVDGLLRRFADRPADRRRRALLNRLGSLESKTDRKAAEADWRSAGIAPDICLTLSDPPTVKGHEITEEDYPIDAIGPEIQGVTVADFTIAADGRITGSRLILSSPPLTFEPTLAAELPGFKISTPANGGRPRACRGLVQSVVWRMPDRSKPEDFQGLPPFKAPEEESGT